MMWIECDTQPFRVDCAQNEQRHRQSIHFVPLLCFHPLFRGFLHTEHTIETHFRPRPLCHATTITTACMCAYFRCFYIVYVSIATNHSRINAIFFWTSSFLRPHHSTSERCFDAQTNISHLIDSKQIPIGAFFDVGDDDDGSMSVQMIDDHSIAIQSYWTCEKNVRSSHRLTALLLQLSQLVFFLLYLFCARFFPLSSLDFLILCI